MVASPGGTIYPGGGTIYPSPTPTLPRKRGREICSRLGQDVSN